MTDFHNALDGFVPDRLPQFLFELPDRRKTKLRAILFSRAIARAETQVGAWLPSLPAFSRFFNVESTLRTVVAGQALQTVFTSPTVRTAVLYAFVIENLLPGE